MKSPGNASGAVTCISMRIRKIECIRNVVVDVLIFQSLCNTRVLRFIKEDYMYALSDSLADMPNSL